VSASTPGDAPHRSSLNPTSAFLVSVYELLEENGVPPTCMQVYDRVAVSRTSASQRMARLEQDGLVGISADRRVRLTRDGLRRAAVVVRKHRLAERLLVDLIGLEPSLAHREATRWQHVLGDRVEIKLLGLLDGPWRSPFGNPIPAIEELGPEVRPPPAEPADEGCSVVRCDYFARQGGGLVRIHSIGEGAQASQALLHRLTEARITPGTALTVSKPSTRDVIAVRCRETRLSIPADLASLIFVSVDTGPGRRDHRRVQ
jgi:DtxR family transcriptional regulator, Mn-dependent transcriptional regulator